MTDIPTQKPDPLFIAPDAPCEHPRMTDSHAHCPDCAEPNERPVGESVADVMKAIESATAAYQAHGSEEPPPDPLEARKQAELDRQDRVRRIVETRGVPHRQAMRLLFGDVEESDALRIYRKWHQQSQPGSILVLAGPLGSGKTLAAAQAVIDGPPRSYYGRAWPAVLHPRFIDVGQLQSMGLYDRSGDYNVLCRCSVLAIDDLGREYVDQPGVLLSLIDGLIDRRYRGCGWTIMTTNLPRREFEKRYGGRVMHRLNEPGCGFVSVTGDYRKDSNS